ncbi:MAG: hypothetical protein K0R14_1742 [Burkholderiales bacterium]|jgi:hypothetical protein|nr:hypothetical protein [Burkholderiales bacterium]
MKRLILCLMAVCCVNTFATTDVQNQGAVLGATAPVASTQLANNDQPYGTPITGANNQGMGNDPSNAAPTQPTAHAPQNGDQAQAQQPSVPGANPLDGGHAFGANTNQPDPNDPSNQQNADQNGGADQKACGEDGGCDTSHCQLLTQSTSHGLVTTCVNK